MHANTFPSFSPSLSLTHTLFLIPVIPHTYNLCVYAFFHECIHPTIYHNYFNMASIPEFTKHSDCFASKY